MGTFAIASKTNTIGIVTITEASADDKSEKSSIRSSTDLSLRLLLLHEISLSSLLATYNVECGNSSSYSTYAGNGANIKIYSLASHPIQPYVLVAATSVGIVVCSISQQCRLVGSHISWNNCIFTYSDKVLRKSRLKFIQEENANIRRSVVSHHRSRSVSRPPSGRVSISVLKGDLENAATTLAVDVLEEITVSESATSAGSLTPQKMKKPTTTQFPTGTTTSQPTIHVSLSGAYVALVWPESLLYIVYRVEKCAEVDRGHCYSFAWTASLSTGGDVYLVITPMMKIETGAKPKKGFHLFQGKAINENVLPSLVVVKIIRHDADTGSSSVESSPSPSGFEDVGSITSLHSGSFMCVTKMTKVAKKTLALSQIELEAMKAEGIEEVPEKVKWSSQFYRLEDDDKIGFAPVGTLMSKVSSVEWSKNHVAVLIDTRINILCISDNKMSVIASVDMGGVYSQPQSMTWWHDALFVTTPSAIAMVVLRQNSDCGSAADVYQLASLNEVVISCLIFSLL